MSRQARQLEELHQNTVPFLPIVMLHSVRGKGHGLPLDIAPREGISETHPRNAAKTDRGIQAVIGELRNRVFISI